MSTRPEFVVVKLEYPIMSENKEVPELRLVRPKVKQMEAMDSMPGLVSSYRALIAACSGIERSAAQQLDSVDFAKCRGALAKMGFTFEIADLADESESTESSESA